MKTLFAIIGIIILLSAGAAFAVTKLCQDDWCYVFPWQKQTAEAAINNFEDCVHAGNPVAESYPRQCIANGKSFTERIGNELEKQDLIRVESPRPNTAIDAPLTITGEARGNWYFEASFPILLLDANDEDLGRAVAQAQGEWMTTNFVRFKATMYFTPSTTEHGTLVLKKDNPSGLPENEDELRIPVIFKTTASAENTMVVKLFFGNRNLDPEGFSCGTTYTIERRIPKTSSPARSALEQLLEGPTNAEAEQEYFTSINSGVKIQSLTIEGGIAKVDFDSTIEQAVGGSCRVGAIRSQITNTLMQFSTVKSVVISIDGRTEDILQP